MHDEPLVSVITTFLNTEKYLKESIESVLNQTYTNFELILIDDGSNDNSIRIGREYTNKYTDKVHYLEHDGHQNKGISASRNLGVCNARGKYIATLDADDVWVKHKLEQQVEILEAYPEAGMVCGDTKYWHGWTGNPEDIELDRYMHDKINLDILRPNKLIHPPTLLLLMLKDNINAVSMSNIMLRKEVIEQVRGFEDNFTGMHEDQAFLAKIYLNSPVYLSAACWDLYRQHRESCNHIAKETGKRTSSELFYLNWLEKYFEENNITNPELLDALHRRKRSFKHHALQKFRQKITDDVKKFMKFIGLRVLTRSDWEYIVSIRGGRKYHRPSGWVDLGEPGTLKPAGESRYGCICTPIDQYNIYQFLKNNSEDIRGRVIEIGTERIAHQYGHENVVKSDLVNPATNADAQPGRDNMIDFASDLPSDTYDCVIIVNSFQSTQSLSPVIKTLHRILKPTGVVLAIMKGIGIVANEQSVDIDRNRHLACLSVKKLFEEGFPINNISITCFGNVLAAKSFLIKLVSRETDQGESNYSNDRDQIVIGVRAAKNGQSSDKPR